MRACRLANQKGVAVVVKSAAAFATKPFIDHADYTSNRTFLRAVAYPFCRRAAEFYA